MAYAAPDPLKVEADRKRAQALHEAAMREIADIEARRQREARIAEEIRVCYFDGTTKLGDQIVQGYSPKQIKHAGRMIRDGQKHDEHQLRIALAEAEGKTCWERIGRSRGGKRKGNLYRCLVS